MGCAVGCAVGGNLDGIPELDEGNVVVVQVCFCRRVARMRDIPHLPACPRVLT